MNQKSKIQIKSLVNITQILIKLLSHWNIGIALKHVCHPPLGKYKLIFVQLQGKKKRKWYLFLLEGKNLPQYKLSIDKKSVTHTEIGDNGVNAKFCFVNIKIMKFY